MCHKMYGVPVTKHVNYELTEYFSYQSNNKQ